MLLDSYGRMEQGPAAHVPDHVSRGLQQRQKCVHFLERELSWIMRFHADSCIFEKSDVWGPHSSNFRTESVLVTKNELLELR